MNAAECSYQFLLRDQIVLESISYNAGQGGSEACGWDELVLERTGPHRSDPMNGKTRETRVLIDDELSAGSLIKDQDYIRGSKWKKTRP